MKKYRQLSGSELVYSGKEETQKDCMPLLQKTVTPNPTYYQVDNTYESSKDVTQRGVIVDILNYSTASKVKPISTISRNFKYLKYYTSWFAANEAHGSARLYER